KRRAPVKPKGRQVDTAARREIATLLGDAPHRRDLLIEYLHRIQDRFGFLSAAHLAALAAELRLALAEVYEVATFYHNFRVVRDGPPPAAPTVRLCGSLPCALFGTDAERARLLAAGERVETVACLGRCDHAPAMLGPAAAVPDDGW